VQVKSLFTNEKGLRIQTKKTRCIAASRITSF
jgi:hypothetical protein